MEVIKDFAGKVVNEVSNPESVLRKEGFNAATGKLTRDVRNTIAPTLSVRNGYNPRVRDFIRVHGNCVITALTLTREPVSDAIIGALDVISMGSFKQAMRRAKYDEMFHLGLVCSFTDKRGRPWRYLFEKNAVIEVRRYKQPKNAQTLAVTSITPGVTVNDMLAGAEKLAGSAYFKYDAFENNCQVFVLHLLQAAGGAGPEEHKFVMQPVVELLQEQPEWLSKVARAATNAGAVVDHLYYGAGPTIVKDFPAPDEVWAGQTHGFQPAAVAMRILADERQQQHDEIQKQLDVTDAEKWDQEHGVLPGTNAAFSKINKALIQAADAGVEHIIPNTAIAQAYQTFAPEGSKYFRGGAGDVDDHNEERVMERAEARELRRARAAVVQAAQAEDARRVEEAARAAGERVAWQQRMERARARRLERKEDDKQGARGGGAYPGAQGNSPMGKWWGDWKHPLVR